MNDQSQPLNALIVNAGAGRQEAINLGNGIFLSKDVSNAYRILTSAGDVMVNTGIFFNRDENFRRLSAVSSNPIVKIIFTQSHDDHIGGWQLFNQLGTETIAQANFAHVRGYFRALEPIMKRRSRHLWHRDIKEEMTERPEPLVTTTFFDSYAFELGGRQFELYSVPGGETIDSLVVWLPQERIAFTGNMTGPIFGHVPNLYTLRGDKIRYVQWYLDSVKRVMDLQPDVLITGHGEPIRGADLIQRELGKMHAAVSFIKEQTFAGMNAGKDLWTLMDEVKLPAEMSIGQGHGKVPWLVRAIWEEHLGWFRFESTTELYSVPPTAVFPDLVELAGGAEPVLTRARLHLQEGRALQALHLTEAVLRNKANDRAALEIKLAATERLLTDSGRENFSEVRWLEAEIRSISAALEAAKS